jgi:hypothetical protein
VIDGTGITLPDTPKNKEKFAQPSSQLPGCSSPIMKVVACFCLASGVLIKWVETELKRHESRIPVKLLGYFQADNVIFTDRGFSSYGNLATLSEKDVDTVVRAHQARKLDYRKDKALGPLDRLIEWMKPQRPDGWNKAHWNSLPGCLTLRIVRIRITVSGFRVRQHNLVTTLLDAVNYTSEAKI